MEEIIELLRKATLKLEKQSQNEFQFGIDGCITLERYSWELFKMTNNLHEIQQVYGG